MSYQSYHYILPLAALGFTSAAIASACSDATQTESTSVSMSGGSGGGSSSSSSSSNSSSGSGGSNSAPPEPDPSCLVPDVNSDMTTIGVSPNPINTTDTPWISVTDQMTGHTNVGVRLCTPKGAVNATFGGVDSGNPPYAWHWTAPALPFGKTQVQFSADPAGKVYRTLNIDVLQDEPSDAGIPDAAPGPTDLCNPAPGNLLQFTTFEDGMNGLAPTSWQVRSPDLPNGACLQSGTPQEHVFLTSAAPGCGGNAIALDARGQWDCYAIQIYSDYNTIVGGATYRISAAARSTGNTVNPAAWFHIGANWLDGNDAVFGDVKNPKPSSGDQNDYEWKVVYWDVVAPANAKRIVVWLSAHYPGRVDFDNISVVKL